MKIGVSGHQERDGIDWEWVRISVRNILIEKKASTVFSSLAAGSDQIFASQALELDIPLAAVIPFADYERCFSGENLQNYRQILSRASSRTIISNDADDDETLFFEAGKKICHLSELMVFIWDGKPSVGKGGTGDIVSVAIAAQKEMIWLDPIRLIQQNNAEF